jgi:hypothetical protein
MLCDAIQVHNPQVGTKRQAHFSPIEAPPDLNPQQSMEFLSQQVLMLKSIVLQMDKSIRDLTAEVLQLKQNKIQTASPDAFPPTGVIPLKQLETPNALTCSQPLVQEKINEVASESFKIVQSTKKKINPNKIKANQRTYAEATKLSVPEMESSSNQSSATMKTIASDTSTHSEVKKAPTSQQTLVSRLEKSNTTEEKLNLLLRSVRPQTDQPKIIMSTIMSLNLRSNVRSTPMVAWKAAVKAWSGKDPLLISLFAPGKAEIFYEFKDTEDIFRVPAGCKIFQAEVTKKDVPRRARAYLHGYYKELRRAACLGFDFESKKLLLEQASKLLPTMFHSKDIRQRWEKTIAYDLSQLQED